ncbi:MAG: hypothetical protein WC291_07960 [Thermodesulfovibrionales bacterium]|jgi:hypothetical protein
MGGMIERLVVGPIEVFLQKVILFLPNLFSAISILIIGILGGWLVKAILTRVLRLFRLDEITEKWGMGRIMEKGGMRGPFSAMTARFAGWLTFLFFLLISLGSLNIFAAERLFERFLLYLPNIFIAVIIFFIGYILSNFFGRAALITSVNAGLKVSRVIGSGVKLSIILFSISIALEQLGIGRETMLIAFAILFGGVVLALALAFGLGGRSIARDYLGKKFAKEEKEDSINHL